MSRVLRQHQKLLIRRRGADATLHTRVEWDGKPTATPQGSGGSIPAGDHWYTVTVTKDGAERWGAGKTKATCVNNDSVALSWTAVTGATNYKIYRNTNAKFPSPSLIATVMGSTTYTDTAASPSAGSPPTEKTLPYVYFTDSTVKAARRGRGTAERQILSGGKVLQVDIMLAVAYDVTVKELDEITYVSNRYVIDDVDQIADRGVVVENILACRRMLA